MTITKDEFIEGYVARSNAKGMNLKRTPDGYSLAGLERLAMPCRCGDDACEGWQMMSRESINSAVEFYGADWFERLAANPVPPLR